MRFTHHTIAFNYLGAEVDSSRTAEEVVVHSEEEADRMPAGVEHTQEVEHRDWRGVGHSLLVGVGSRVEEEEHRTHKALRHILQPLPKNRQNRTCII